MGSSSPGGGDLSHGTRLAELRRGEGEKGADLSLANLNGRFVTLSSASYDPSGSVVDCWIDQWDIGSGVRTLYKLYPGEPVIGKPYGECHEVVVVTAPDGRLAWQVRPEPTGPLRPGEPRIHAWTPSGVAILDPGPSVEPGSLIIDGFTARWTRAGEPQAADLTTLP